MNLHIVGTPAHTPEPLDNLPRVDGLDFEPAAVPVQRRSVVDRLQGGRSESPMSISGVAGAGQIGVDLNPGFIADVRVRTDELGVTDAVRFVEAGASDYLTLPGLLASFGAKGCDGVDMVCASEESWDRYQVPPWLTVRRWAGAFSCPSPGRPPVT